MNLCCSTLKDLNGRIQIYAKTYTYLPLKMLNDHPYTGEQFSRSLVNELVFWKRNWLLVKDSPAVQLCHQASQTVVTLQDYRNSVQPLFLLYLLWMRKGDFCLLFTVGTPTTAVQPPFQPQYVSYYVLLTYISAFHTLCCESTSVICMQFVCTLMICLCGSAFVISIRLALCTSLCPLCSTHACK